MKSKGAVELDGNYVKTLHASDNVRDLELHLIVENYSRKLVTSLRVRIAEKGCKL